MKDWFGNEIEMKDWFGNEIKVGDYLVRPGMSGRSGILGFALITEIADTAVKSVTCWFGWGSRVTNIKVGVVNHPNRCWVIPEEHVPAAVLSRLQAHK